jgi:hypothetical protein
VGYPLAVTKDDVGLLSQKLKCLHDQGHFAKRQKSRHVRIRNLIMELDKFSKFETWKGVSGQDCHCCIMAPGIAYIGPGDQRDSPGQGR